MATQLRMFAPEPDPVEAEIQQEAQAEVDRKSDGIGEIVRRFIEKLDDPSKYEYRGEVIDLGHATGRCVCEHPIRYEFLIYSPEGKQAIVGSECINHFALYNPALYASLTKAKTDLLERIKEEIKKAREARYAKEAQQAAEPYTVAVAEASSAIRRYRENNPGKYWMPNSLYVLSIKLRKGVPRYKRTRTYIGFYKREVGEIYSLLEEFKKGQ